MFVSTYSTAAIVQMHASAHACSTISLWNIFRFFFPKKMQVGVGFKQREKFMKNILNPPLKSVKHLVQTSDPQLTHRWAKMIRKAYLYVCIYTRGCTYMHLCLPCESNLLCYINHELSALLLCSASSEAQNPPPNVQTPALSSAFEPNMN